MSYASDRTWSDLYIPALKQIVGPLLLDEAPLEHDMQQATDLIVFTARDMRIGCRVRRPGYAGRYPWQFTLRSRRDSGATTELTKIIDGWGDWLVYTHADIDSRAPRLSHWLVLNLNVFRAQMIRSWALREHTRTQQIPNGDGTYFVPYDVRALSPDLVVASSHRVPRAEQNAAA
jgi:hypothetical protein